MSGTRRPRAERLREIYAGGAADRTARRLSRFWAWAFTWGLLPRRWVTLEVVGRGTGKPTRFPLGMADVGGRWYLVSMLGESCNWVRNVRSAGGAAVLRRRRAWPVLLTEVPVDRRAPVIRRYLEKVPGGRPHIGVAADAPEAEIERVAAVHPVFEIAPRDSRLAGG